MFSNQSMKHFQFYRLVLVLSGLIVIVAACQTSMEPPTGPVTTPAPSPRPLPTQTPVPSPTPSSIIARGTLAYLLPPTGDHHAHIVLTDVETGKTRNLDFDCYFCSGFSFSPDKAYVAVTGAREFSSHMKNQLLLLNLENQVISQPTTLLPTCQESIAWSPDGKYLAYTNSEICHSQNDVEVIEIATGQIKKLTKANGWKFGLAWSPNGKYIAYGYQETSRNGNSQTIYESVWVMDSNGNNPRQIADMPFGYQFQLSWSPDSTAVAFSSPSQCGDIYVADMRFNYARLFFRPVGCASNPVWSPDGKTIAVLVSSNDSITHQNKGWEIDLVSVDGKDVVQLAHSQPIESRPFYLGWAP